MAKEDVEKIFDESKDTLSKKHGALADNIRESLEKFKKETLAKI